MKLLPCSEDYSKNSVNAAKVTDHHALLITENAAIGLFKDEKIVYDMILCRMIEAFSADIVSMRWVRTLARRISCRTSMNWDWGVISICLISNFALN